MFEFNIEFGWWVLVPIILVYVLGVWMGNTGKLVVYRNYTDVTIVGLLVIIPLAALSTILFFAGSEKSAGQDFAITSTLFLVLLAVLAAIFLFVIIRTWIDNPNPLKAILALYVKIPTGIMFFISLSSVFFGTTRKKRRESIFWTIVMAPLLYGLVADKTGYLPGRIRKLKH